LLSGGVSDHWDRTRDIFEDWFEFLYSLTGKRLKTALGNELAKKYSRHLREKQVEWGAGCLSDLCIVWIVGEISKRHSEAESPLHLSLYAHRENTNAGISMALRRWKEMRFFRNP
jgi:hypothetical protein